MDASFWVCAQMGNLCDCCKDCWSLSTWVHVHDVLILDKCDSILHHNHANSVACVPSRVFNAKLSKNGISIPSENFALRVRAALVRMWSLFQKHFRLITKRPTVCELTKFSVSSWTKKNNNIIIVREKKCEFKQNSYTHKPVECSEVSFMRKYKKMFAIYTKEASAKWRSAEHSSWVVTNGEREGECEIAKMTKNNNRAERSEEKRREEKKLKTVL